MANMLDYLAWRGDIALTERPFNEVDNLILSELAYARFEDIVPGPEAGGEVTLARAAARYRELGYTSALINDPGALLAAAGESARFSAVRLSRYVNRIDPARAVQFSAVCFALPDGTLYVAYRGTDDTLVGWREDFNFAFTRTIGQAEAAEYLNRAAAGFGGPLRVGGHSKGGNLAAYAASFCAEDVKARILNVYSNDGPGFNQSVARSAEYGAMLDRISLIIPESSLVGVLLDNRAKRRVVKSSASGVLQHNPLTWQVRGTAFEGVDGQSAASLFMDETLGRWLDGLSDEQRRNLVSAIFDSMDASGAVTLAEMNENKWDSYGAILKAAGEIDPAVRKDVLNTLGKLANAGRDVFLEDARASLERWLDQTAQRFRPEGK